MDQHDNDTELDAKLEPPASPLLMLAVGLACAQRDRVVDDEMRRLRITILQAEHAGDWPKADAARAELSALHGLCGRKNYSNVMRRCRSEADAVRNGEVFPQEEVEPC